MTLSLITFAVAFRAAWILYAHYDVMCPRRELHAAHRLLAPPPSQPLRWFLGWWRSLQAWWLVFSTDSAIRTRYRAWWIMWGSVTCLTISALELLAKGHGDFPSWLVLFSLGLWAIVHEHFNALFKSGR